MRKYNREEHRKNRGQVSAGDTLAVLLVFIQLFLKVQIPSTYGAVTVVWFRGDERCSGEIIFYETLPTPKYKLNIILTKCSLSLVIVQHHTHDLQAALNSRKHSWLHSKGLVSGPGDCGK